MLEYMYKSCTALYTYPNCQAIDKAAAIRVCKNGQTNIPSPIRERQELGRDFEG